MVTLAGFPPEGGDVLLEPAQGQVLVLVAEVAQAGLDEVRPVHEAVQLQPVVEVDPDEGLARRDGLLHDEGHVVLRVAVGARDVGAVVDPDADGQLLILHAAGTDDIQRQAVLGRGRVVRGELVACGRELGRVGCCLPKAVERHGVAEAKVAHWRLSVGDTEEKVLVVLWVVDTIVRAVPDRRRWDVLLCGLQGAGQRYVRQGSGEEANCEHEHGHHGGQCCDCPGSSGVVGLKTASVATDEDEKLF